MRGRTSRVPGVSPGKGTIMVTKCERCPLRDLKTFVPFTAEELRFMRTFKTAELTVGSNAVVLMEGARAPQLYTVLSGQGVRYKMLPDGRRQVIDFVFPGDFLGLQSGVMGEMGHSVVSATEMTLCVFDRAEIWSLFKSHPDRAFDITWLSASEEMFLGEGLSTVGQRSAIESVAWTLQLLFKRAESLGLSIGNAMPLPFRQQDLADALGLSLVHTNKTLAKLKERGVATWQDGVLTVTDPQGLSAAAGVPAKTPKPRPLM